MFAILYRLLLSLYSELSFRTIRRKRNAKCHNFEVPLKDGWNVNFVLFDKRLIFPRLNKCHIDVQYYVLSLRLFQTNIFVPEEAGARMFVVH